jgi:hypothetical protein
LNTVDILCPEVNSSSLHKNQTTSIPKKVIAREIRSRAGELKAGLKSDFDPVGVPLCPENQKRRYAVSSDTEKRLKAQEKKLQSKWQVGGWVWD